LTADGREYASDSGVTRFGPVGIALPGGGRSIAFLAKFALDPRDTNHVADVYVRNRQTGAVTWASVDPNGAPWHADCLQPRMSNDGRFVLYGVNDGGGFVRLFVRDLQLSATALLSANPDGYAGAGDALSPDISANGRFVVFTDSGPNLVE